MDFRGTLSLPAILRFVLAIIWGALLSILLLQPAADPIIPTGIPLAPPSFERELFFSLLHLITFGITAMIWCFAFGLSSNNRLQVLTLGLVLLAYGLGVEYLQGSVPNRTAQWWDMLANGLGIVIGMWSYYRIDDFIRKRRDYHFVS